jgi:ribulose-5-phosphate 4-epimerase/fuculose-1-phosphate aldolase
VSLELPAPFATVEDERQHRKQKLAGALRIFGRVGFGEGVAGHITVRDPEFPELFWVNPFAVSFRHIRVSDLILVDHDGNVVYGTRPVNRAAFVIHSAVHEARPDVIAAAHSHSVHGKAFSSLGIPLEPITQDSCIFYEDHTVVTAQRGRVQFDVDDGRELVSQFPTRQGRDPPEPRAVHRRPERRRGGVLVPQHGPLVPGAAARDGRRHARSGSRTRTPPTPASRPPRRSPAG